MIIFADAEGPPLTLFELGIQTAGDAREEQPIVKLSAEPEEPLSFLPNATLSNGVMTVTIIALTLQMLRMTSSSAGSKRRRAKC
mmetsp:Transcript_15187/g.22227  ORF Transcript_15187/g.22227 Transcript_15187/m.22227 type:complete len:84 (+) Transcript_15187:121-372(+)|eukprot:CAMPEP_0197247748 /NCGR_PEP_ID=MMETSP1429-20130617/31903_1 /TAXON_ID=49237 /ORGANISM="Chaetoceros  sp., Strain UNC1202" /LENGTH=83 /DNA_ID=CAMNT_0042708745 /DNA_START=104 /DNA_END=355 /DNA_ORIENTATION=-